MNNLATVSMQMESVILLVDDNPANLGVVAAGLEQSGYRVLVAEDGTEALERAERILPDLILLDVMMPGIDGFEVCRRLKASTTTCAIPVIFMTVLTAMKDKLTAFELGAVDYVTKPLQVEEVIARVGTQLELASYRDNLERVVDKRTAELAARERELRTLVNNAPDFIIRLDDHCRHIFANPQFEAAFGVSIGRCMGRTPVELYPENHDIAAFQACVEEVILKGQSSEFVLAIPCQDKEQSYYNIHLAAERDGHGQVTGVLAIGRDITRLRAMEHEYRLSEWKFRTLAENLPDVLVRYNQDFRAVYVNPSLLKIYECDAGELIGTRVYERLPDPDLVKRYHQALQKVMTTAVPEQIEIELPRVDGGSVILQVSFVAEQRANGEVHGALAISRDISLLKATEQQLEKSNAQLKAMARRRESAREEERNHIAREIHDELGQYLTALRLNTTVVIIEFASRNPALRRKLEKLLSLVDSTKKVARNLSQRLRPAELDMGTQAALTELVEYFNIQYGTKCYLDLEEGTDELNHSYSVILYRVLQESLTNIARHAKASSVEVILKSNDAWVVLTISDDGKGFDPAQVETARFGLVGMRERLLAVGGELEIITKRQSGTHVVARLPIINDEQGVNK